MDIRTIMFSLIRSELQEIALSEDIKNELILENIEKIISLSARHDMAHIVVSALTKEKLSSSVYVFSIITINLWRRCIVIRSVNMR